MMKYKSIIHNCQGDPIELDSMDDYICTESDVQALSDVLDDPAVRRYISDNAMKEWGHGTPASLARDILENSAKRWHQWTELRFLARDSHGHPVGMIGVNLPEQGTRAELWYYKKMSTPAFMRTALTKTLDHLQQEGVNDLFSEIDKDNQSSIRLLEELGFTVSMAQADRLVMEKRMPA